MSANPSLKDLRVIAASLGKRYSGINASMLAVIPEQLKRECIVACGFHIPTGIPRISFAELWKLRDGAWRVWHARRNIDMLAGILLRFIFRFRFKLLFTSAAQRRHSWITRWYYHRMDACIATTARGASFLTRSSHVVLHGVDTKRFAPAHNRSHEWLARGVGGSYGIGVFGRIRESKGSGDLVDALIEVLPQRPEWTAVFVGQATAEHASYAQSLKNKLFAAGLGERVHFTGFVNNSEIPVWYRSLSVVVCPSRTEGFGLPCLEGMASGAPVVATQTGAWEEIIDQGITGHIVPCAQPTALAQALRTITAHPETAATMGAEARKHVLEHFSISREAEEIQTIYDTLLERI